MVENYVRKAEFYEYLSHNGIEEPNVITYKSTAKLQKALDNKEACLQRNTDGHNIGMMAALHCLEKASLKAIENKEASLQQDLCLRNLGMFVAFRGYDEATLKALDNEESNLQQDTCGRTIFNYISDKKDKLPMSYERVQNMELFDNIDSEIVN